MAFILLHAEQAYTVGWGRTFGVCGDSSASATARITLHWTSLHGRGQAVSLCWLDCADGRVVADGGQCGTRAMPTGVGGKDAVMTQCDRRGGIIMCACML